MAFVDISGFTAMAERLAKLGREGAEEVSDIINSVFARLLAVAYENGGSLLKFGGDALLLFFDGPKHAGRACHAAAWMRRRLREIGRVRTSAGLATLRMHVGIHSGEFDFFVLGQIHRELVVTGPAASVTVAMESTAVAGEILVSEATAGQLPSGVLGAAKGGGRLLVRTPPPPLVASEVAVPDGADPSPFIPPRIRDYVSGIVDPEHRRVAISFVRFDGADELIAREGPEAAAEQLDVLVRTVQSAIEPNSVVFLDSDPEQGGGKFMLVAGAPSSSERDCEQMLRAARAIVESPRPFSIRIGVNYGHVFSGLIGPSYRRKYSVIGDAVNLAARLMAKARPDQIIATPAVLDRSQAVFGTTELEEFHVKGKAHPILAFDVGPMIRSRGSRPAEEAPLVGRGPELDILLAMLATARAGSGSLLEIAAEPGMGKSRLVSELRGRAHDVRYLGVGAEEYESSTPYYLVQRLVRAALGIDRGLSGREAGDALQARVEALAPDILAWLPLVALAVDAEVDPTPEVQRLDDAFKAQQLHRAVVRVLDAALPGPSVIVLEDVHWIDHASADFVRFLARDLRRRPWLVCATRRVGGESFVEAAQGAGRVLELAPLAAEASTDLARAAAGDLRIAPQELARLSDRAGGNPLFLQELVAGLRAAGNVNELPDTIEAVIGARIDRLSGPERSLLRNASVLGLAFGVDLLRDMLASPASPAGAITDEALDATLSNFIEREAPGTWRFRHALIRDVAYEGLPFRRRRLLHRRVGEVLEGRAGEELGEQSEALSLHFHLARDVDRTWRYSVMAGDRARAKFASFQAAEFYQRGLEAGKRAAEAPAGELLRVNEALGDVSERVGAYDDAASAYRVARRLAGSTNSGLRRLFLKEGVLRLRMGLYSQALRWYSRGLRAASGSDASGAADLVELAVAYAGVRYYQGRYTDCIEWCKRSVPDAIAAGDTSGLAHAYLLLHLAYTHLGAPDHVAYRGLALPLFEQLGDFTRQGYVLNNMGIDAYYDGDWDRARELYDHGQHALEQAGGIVDSADVTYNIAEILSDQGRLDEAEKLTREILETYRAARYPVGEALATGNLGRIASRAGRFTEAVDLLEDALQRFTDLGDDRFTLEMECRIVELCVFMVAPDEALRRVSGVLDRIKKIGNVPALFSMVKRLEGYAMAQSGEHGAAVDRIQESITVARESKTPYELALSLLALATVVGERDADATDAATAEGQEILDRLGVLTTPSMALI